MKKEKKRPGLLNHLNKMADMDWRMFSKVPPIEQKLTGKVIVITGGDNAIGRTVAVKFALHGAKIVMLYWKERGEVLNAAKYIVRLTGMDCIVVECDSNQEENCIKAMEEIVQEYGQIDVLVNNTGTPFASESIEDITNPQLEQIFRENVFPMLYFSKAVLPHMKKGGTIVNAASVTSYCEIETDYSATQGAIVTFTRSLAAILAKKEIRVNGIAPGTCAPFIPSSHEIEIVEEYGVDNSLTFIGKYHELLSCYVYLASEDSSGITGQLIYPNGTEIITLAKN